MKRYSIHSLIGFNIVMMRILSKLIYRLNTIPITVTAVFSFAEIDSLFLKFTWKYRGYRIAKTILKKIKTKLEDSHFLFSKFITKLQCL